MTEQDAISYRIVWCGSSRASALTSYAYPTIGVEAADGRLWRIGQMCMYSPSTQDFRALLADAPEAETCDGPWHYDCFVRVPAGWLEVLRDQGTGAVCGLRSIDYTPQRHLYFVRGRGWAPAAHWDAKGVPSDQRLTEQPPDTPAAEAAANPHH